MVARDNRPVGGHIELGALHVPLDEVPGAFRVHISETDNLVDTNYNMNLDEPLSAFFNKGVPVVNFFLVASFVGKMLYHDLSIALPLSIVFLTCLVFSLFIHVVMINWCWNSHGEWRCMVAYLSTMLRMFAATTIVLFLDTIHLVVVLPILLLVVALVTYFFKQTFCIRVTPGMNWENYTEDLKLQFDISALVVSMAFGGLSGKVLGYGKAPYMISGYTQLAVAPECFLFYGVVLGLLVVLLCTVPTRILLRSTRQQMARVYIPASSYIALFFLVLAGIKAAEEIVEYAFLVCFFIVVIAILISWWEASSNQTEPAGNTENAQREQDFKVYQYLITAYFTPLFAAVMATQSKYSFESGSAASLSWWFKAFILSAVCSILSHAVRIVVSTWRPGMRSRDLSTKLWTYATYGTMACTIFFAGLLVYRRPDEIVNIF